MQNYAKIMDPKLSYLRVTDEVVTSSTTCTEAASFRQQDCVAPLEMAEIVWKNINQPESKRFEDVYYCAESGLDESRYVFLEGNDLANRWSNRENFVVAEFGFGTGLNFLSTHELWLRRSKTQSLLHYIAFEKHPMRLEDQKRALAAWPELDFLSSKLLAKLPPAVPGFHCLGFWEHNLQLTLIYGDVRHTIAQLSAVVDAWYLDGFAPIKNRSIWSDLVFRQMAQRSGVGATFSTYTAARKVRDGLSDVGFSVSKEQGFGRKRDMLRGVFRGKARMFKTWSAYRSKTGSKFCLSKRPDSSLSPTKRFCGRAIVIGAGLAGCSLVRSLSRRNWQLVLIDQCSRVAEKASGNPRAVLSPHLGVKLNYSTRFYLSAFLHTQRLIAELESEGCDVAHVACGVLQLATNKRTEKLYKNISTLGLPEDFVCALDAKEASSRVAAKVDSPGLWFPTGAWVDPSLYCRALLSSCKSSVSLLLNTQVAELKHVSGYWQAYGQDGKLLAEADIVVFANSWEAPQSPYLSWLPIEKIRGQLLWSKSSKVLSRLKSIVCYEGYVLPELDGLHLIGASYEHDKDDEEIDRMQEIELISRLQRRLPELASTRFEIEGGRVSFRAMSPDRLPMVGGVSMYEGFEDAYRMLNNGLYGKVLPLEYNYPGLYMSLAHGSRGLLSASLSAELIATLVDNEPRPLENDLVSALHPGRFLARMIRKSTAESLRNTSLRFSDSDSEAVIGSDSPRSR